MKQKEDVIKEAWGEYWELFTPTTQHKILNNHGKVDYFLLTVKERGDTEKIIGDIRKLLCVGTDEGTPRMFTPKSLQGIETNNGWIKVESESDLPKDFCDVWVLNSFGDIEQTEFNADYKSFHGYFSERNCGKVTHYQPIPKPLPPLY